MSVKIKLCGLRTAQAIRCANMLLPDYVGFVFVPESKRHIHVETAGALRRLLDPRILSVGVFTDAKMSFITRLAEEGIIDVIQLHGHEDETYIRALQNCTTVPIIQAFKVHAKADIQRAEQSSADIVLLDGGAGTGKPFSWTLIKGLRRPYFLAGGLDADNIETALAQLAPYGVDVSSGIETAGEKDPEKMRAFVMKVRENRRKEGIR